MDELKKQAEELGIKVDGRWSAERLQAEIDEKLAEAPAPVVEQPDVEPVVEAPVVESEEPADPVEPEPELSTKEKTDAEAEIEAEIQARFDEAQAQAEDAVVVTSLIENPMKVFGLTGKGSTAIFTRSQLAADKRLVAKLERAEAAGMVSVEEA